MADIDLPVFSFRANWKEPMIERLAFLTDVLRSTEGAEQRRSVRQTPRRTYEADFLLIGRERTFWDLFIDRLGGGEVLAPLYWEVQRLTHSLTATVSDRIDFDTTRTLWEQQLNGLILLIGPSALDFEVAEIVDVELDGLDLAAPVTKSWPIGTMVMPLRRAVLDQVGDVSHVSAAVATVTAQLRVIGPNPWTLPEEESPVYDPYPIIPDTTPTYAGLPVLLNEPNWVDGLDVSMDREVALLDTDVGLTYQVDTLGRTLVGQAHRWFLPGRTKLAEFRDLIYRYRGRAKAFWLPTFKADMKLVADADSGATQIEIENIGFGYVGGPSSGREYIAIKHSGGTILRKILSVVPGSTSATEKLNLDAPLGLALSPGQVRRISFADTARFDNDEFEIVHFGGVEAHHEANARFRTFKNTRTSPTPIHFPIEPGVMNAGPCGSPFTLVNPSFEQGTTGWSGSIATRTANADGDPAYDGERIGWPGNNAESEFWQTLPVPSAWYARVDAGKAVVSGFSAYHQKYDEQTDHGRLFMEFQDAGNAVISRVNTAFDYSNSWTLLSFPDTPVPAGTRFVRFGTHNVRDEGSENNNDWDRFSPGVLIEVG